MITMDKVTQFYTDHEPGHIGRFREFSVLVPFVEKEGELCILYEVRNKDMESDPGEICFPGGHVEPGEDLEKAALRETEEEIGIPKEKIRIIGKGDTLTGYANYALHTFVGVISYEDVMNARLQEDEVDEIFLTPVSHLMEAKIDHYPETVRAKVPEDFPFETVGIDENYKWRYGRWTIPVSVIDGRVFWGLTLWITEHMIHQLSE